MSPRSKEQFEELRATSIRKILDASLEMFGTKGYEATSMAEIARKAGISKGLIYNYFESKEDLLRGIILDMTQAEEKILSALHSTDPKQNLENLFRFSFKWLRENGKISRLMMSLTLQVDRFDFIHQLAYTKMKEYVLLFEQLLEQINFPNHRTEARILTTLFDGIGIQYLILKEDYPLDEIEQMLINKYCS